MAMNERLVRFGSAGLFVALVLEPGEQLTDSLHDKSGSPEIEFTDEGLAALPARLPPDGHTHDERHPTDSIRQALEYYVSVSPPADRPVVKIRDTTGRVWKVPSEILPYERVVPKG